MKRFFALALLSSLVVLPVSAGMVRVVGVPDARTLVVDDAGRRSTIQLAGIVLSDDDAAPATQYLRNLTFGQWVLVDGGAFVYRSPDGLYVNGEMLRHAWREPSRFKYLGELDLGPSAAKKQPARSGSPAPKRHVRFSPKPHSRPTRLKGTKSWHPTGARTSTRSNRRT